MVGVRSWLCLSAVVGALAVSVACAKPGPPPAAAAAAIPLTGAFVKLDAVETDKYMHYAIGRTIHAPPDVVWAVLTDGPAFTAWNSTVVSLDGAIALGETIDLVSKVDEKRTFHLTVSEFTPSSRMVWEDGNNVFKGVRTFTLAPTDDGGTAFTMKEAFTGSLIKAIAKKLPDFGPSFDAFAADLAREAERRAPPPPPTPAPAPVETPVESVPSPQPTAAP